MSDLATDDVKTMTFEAALTELEGLSQRELAERMNLSLSGAKSRVQRGRKLLEDVLRAWCDFELDVRGNVIACAPRDGVRCKPC